MKHASYSDDGHLYVIHIDGDTKIVPAPLDCYNKYSNIEVACIMQSALEHLHNDDLCDEVVQIFLNEFYNSRREIIFRKAKGGMWVYG